MATSASGQTPSRKQRRAAVRTKRAAATGDDAFVRTRKRDLAGLTLNMSESAIAKSVESSLASHRKVLLLSNDEKARLRASRWRTKT